MRTKICLSAILAITVFGAALAQSGSSAPKSASTDTSIQAIRRYVDSVRQRASMPRADFNMPGAQPSPEHQVVPYLAEEVLRLHKQVAALEKEIQGLKGRK